MVGGSQNHDWLVRVAELSDIEAMQRVRVSVQENTLKDYSVLTPSMYKLNMVECGCGWVCEKRGRVVGFSIVNLKELNVWALFVEPGEEGLGIGRALHDTMISWLRDKGATRLSLDTESGTRAAHFYEVAGWQLVRTDERGESFYEMEL